MDRAPFVDNAPAIAARDIQFSRMFSGVRGIHMLAISRKAAGRPAPTNENRGFKMRKLLLTIIPAMAIAAAPAFAQSSVSQRKHHDDHRRRHGPPRSVRRRPRKSIRARPTVPTEVRRASR